MARTEAKWIERAGGYIETDSPLGLDILINGEDRYLNFNELVGEDGYGFRDNGGVMEFKNNSGAWTAVGSGGVTDHGGLTGLSNDDHTQYALLAGRSGGQTLIGGTASGNNLTLQSTSHATKGSVILGTTTYYDQVNNRLGINNSTPYASLVVTGTSATTARMGFSFSNTYGQTYWTADFSSGSQNSNLLTGYINQIGGTGTQWIVVQGNLQATLAGTLIVGGQTLGQNGTAGLPAFSFSADSDNGMYRISANTLGFAVAGGERLRMASTGFNGVSMSNPKVRWHVANNTAGGTHNAVIIVNNTNAGAGGLATGPYTSIDFSHLNDQASDIQRKMSIGFEKITTFSRGDMVISLDGSADDNNVDYLVDEKVRLTMAGNWGVGTIGQTVSARIHAISTTEQFRLGYDASNYLSATISSTGSATLNLAGTTPRFIFSDGITLPAGTATAGTSPLLFVSGTNLTTAENGAMEYNGTNLFFTRTGATRESVWVGNDGAGAPATNAVGVIVDYYGTSATRVLTTPNSWGSVVVAGTTYKVPLYT